MQPLDAVYLQILKNLCTDLSEPVPLDGVDPSALYRLAEKHCSLPFLLPYFEQQPQFSALKQQTKQMLLSYYQLEHFTRLTFSLLLAEKIPCFLLKGISLAANYPIPEYRKLGDLDLYIPEKDAFSRACRILNAHGYTEEPEESDHHVTYRFTFPETGRSFTLELHYRIVGIYQFSRANELVDEIFSASHLKPSFVELYGQTYPVLPPTENVFYMLHHMLKHYLYSGSYQHTGIHAWFHEGHIQMKLRFPKLHKCVLLWPVLWVITFFCFLSNTYRIRHTTLRQTLADFRADNRKTKLLKIFDNNDLQ